MSTTHALSSTARTLDLPLPADFDDVDDHDTTTPPARPDLAPKAKKAPRKKAPLVLGALVAVAAAIAGYIYVSSRGKESTDDAQVEGHISNVAARVPGQVKRVLVTDDQQVKAGEVLVELDDADLVARLAAAKADLAAAEAGLHAAQTQLSLTRKQVDANLAIARGGIAQAAAVSGSTQAMIDQAQADVVAAQSRVDLARTELTRSQKLVDSGAVPQAELDAKQAAADQAAAALVQARARVVTAMANRSNSSGTAEAARGRLLVAQTAPEQVEAAQAQVELATAKVAQATAAVQQAELNLGYTKIRAEIDGSVAKRNVEPGQMVSPERALMALVGTGDAWVVANFKETQLEDIRPGLRVKVAIDGYGGAPLAGVVESIQAGTGARFSLLPPDNASGNFTKVTQRVPVRIQIADRRGLTLRPGMSANVTVYTAE
jgi:membrane fusion protein, multidrug efflux system